jgi:Zn-dependent M28 family amino/carboxypeptidase
MIRGLEESGWKVERQGFSSSTPQGEVEFVNVIARFGAGGEGGGGKGSRAILCTHYDTKKFSTIEFLGANDGGSGTAGLLEFARALAVEPLLASRVDLVFFDGEEAVQQFSETDGLYGSRYFAQQLRQSGEAGRYGCAILWDMIGDKQLGLTVPSDTPVELMRGLEEAAGRVGLSERVGRFNGPILDDHVPLQHIAGIPSIDLIDFDYLPWHTADDGLDAVSGASVREVALVTLEMLRDRLR